MFFLCITEILESENLVFGLWLAGWWIFLLVKDDTGHTLQAIQLHAPIIGALAVEWRDPSAGVLPVRLYSHQKQPFGAHPILRQ